MFYYLWRRLSVHDASQVRLLPESGVNLFSLNLNLGLIWKRKTDWKWFTTAFKHIELRGASCQVGGLDTEKHVIKLKENCNRLHPLFPWKILFDGCKDWLSTFFLINEFPLTKADGSSRQHMKPRERKIYENPNLFFNGKYHGHKVEEVSSPST